MTSEERARFEEARGQWKERTLKPALGRGAERPGPFADSSGAPLERLHTPADVDRPAYVRDLGFPGEFPFTLRVKPTLYRARRLTTRHYSGFGSHTANNRPVRY